MHGPGRIHLQAWFEPRQLCIQSVLIRRNSNDPGRSWPILLYYFLSLLTDPATWPVVRVGVVG